MKTKWKIMCASQQVCPEVKEKLKEMGFDFLKETPNSSDSDLIMVRDVEKDEIQEKGAQILKICGNTVQQISVSVY